MLQVKVLGVAIIGATVLLAAEGWGTEFRSPQWIEIVVHQSLGQVRFEFFREQGEQESRFKVPVNVYSLSVHFPGGVPRVWELSSPDGSDGTKEITYGVVPRGFVQGFPEQGSPPSLEANGKYDVSVEGLGGRGAVSFIYQGP